MYLRIYLLKIKNLSSMSRRLTLIQAPSDIELENCDEEFSVTVFLTEKGWIRTVEGHNVDENAIKLKDQDKLMCTAKLRRKKATDIHKHRKSIFHSCK